MRGTLILLSSLFLLTGGLLAQRPAWEPAPGHVTLPLWPHPQPGVQSEVDLTTAKDNLVAGKRVVRLTNVSNPTITLYSPAGKNSGAAVIVFPGGAYHVLAIDLEGTEVCDWLTSVGVTCILLKYRVPDSGPLPKSSAALEDAQRAVGMVRAHAAEWQIDTQRVGVLGFSAGAHLAVAFEHSFRQATVRSDRCGRSDELPAGFCCDRLSGVSGLVGAKLRGESGDSCYRQDSTNIHCAK